MPIGVLLGSPRGLERAMASPFADVVQRHGVHGALLSDCAAPAVAKMLGQTIVGDTVFGVLDHIHFH